MLQHNVYFYLKSGLSEAQRSAFLDSLKSLLTIDDMVEGFVGRPGKTAPRPVVDDRYDFALSTVFKDVAQHDVYQDHPVHQKFVQSCKQYWDAVKVFDVEMV